MAIPRPLSKSWSRHCREWRGRRQRSRWWWSIAVNCRACRSHRCSRPLWSSHSCRACSWSTGWTWSRCTCRVLATARSPTDAGRPVSAGWTIARRTYRCRASADRSSTSLASLVVSLWADTKSTQRRK